MKKFMFLPLVLGVMVANAQLKLGAKAGVNISNFTGLDDAVEHESLIGYHAGGIVRFDFGNLVLQPEVLYSVQGAKIKNAGTESEFRLSYINIPIMLQYAFGGKFYVEAGPQAGFKINEDVPDNPTSDDFAKGTNWAAAIGAGFLKS